MAALRLIDSHLHCGVQNVAWPWERLRPLLRAAGVAGAGVMAPVEDIYDRYDYHFPDDDSWRACRSRANRYVAALADPEIAIYPYFFVWNDFPADQPGPPFRAVKWHRHADEPEYRYDDPRCRRFIDRATARRLPILLEETAVNTLRFITELAPAATVVIPHLGMLNGGFGRLAAAGVFARDRVYADTALAAPREIREYIQRYGWDRLIFGSDYPFGDPAGERDKILALGLPQEALAAILAGNWEKLQRQVIEEE